MSTNQKTKDTNNTVNPNIKTDTYNRISSIVEDIHPENYKSVITDVRYKNIHKKMNQYEKEHQKIIIDCIISGTKLPDIYKAINNHIDSSEDNEYAELADNIEKSTLMITEHKVIDAEEPVEVIIGDEKSDLENKPNDNVPLIITDTVSKKTMSKETSLYKLLKQTPAKDHMDMMEEYYRNINYGEKYSDKIYDIALKEYIDAGVIDPTSRFKHMNGTMRNDVFFRVIAYERAHKHNIR